MLIALSNSHNDEASDGIDTLKSHPEILVGEYFVLADSEDGCSIRGSLQVEIVKQHI